jgi:hypothetical protein
MQLLRSIDSARGETTNEKAIRKGIRLVIMTPIARIARASLKTIVEYPGSRRMVRYLTPSGPLRMLADEAAKNEKTFLDRAPTTLRPSRPE